MITLTGFGPFGPPGSVAHETNPSQLLAAEAARRLSTDLEILPVSYSSVADVGRRLSDSEFVLSIGVAGSRTQPLLEQHAVNWQESSIADADGEIARGRTIDSDGPAVVTGMDVPRIAEASGIGVSLSAGTYVCNALSYSLYRHHRSSCFLHIPPAEHLGLEQGVELIERIIACSMSA